MNASAAQKGNNPEQWQKLLDHLDEKLQLGLLNHLIRISAYHFEEETLFIEPASQEDLSYLSKESNRHQLELLAQDAIGIERLKIKKLSEGE